MACADLIGLWRFDIRATEPMEILRRFKPDTEHFIYAGSYIVELLNSENDADPSIARARAKPGVTTTLHCLQETVERYVVLEGEESAALQRQP